MSRYLPGNYLPPLNLHYLTGLTPHHYQIELLDGNIKPFGFREVDFVGITALTGSSCCAYQIAATYRRQGMRTVMGGIRVSMMPEEAPRSCDKEHNHLVTSPCQYPVQFKCKTWVKYPNGTY